MHEIYFISLRSFQIHSYNNARIVQSPTQPSFCIIGSTIVVHAMQMTKFCIIVREGAALRADSEDVGVVGVDAGFPAARIIL